MGLPFSALDEMEERMALNAAVDSLGVALVRTRNCLVELIEAVEERPMCEARVRQAGREARWALEHLTD